MGIDVKRINGIGGEDGKLGEGTIIVVGCG